MPQVPLDLAAAGGAVVAAGVPVLFVDTCALLDVIRVPERVDESRVASLRVKAAVAILDAVRQKQLSIVIPPVVEGEWQEHAAAEQARMERFIERLQRSLAVHVAVGATFGQAMQAPQLAMLELPERLHAISKGLLDEGMHLAQDAAILARSTGRALAVTPPAAKGTYKDCVIYEHALQLMQDLRGLGFQPPIVFISSNTKDFGPAGNPKHPIDTELAAVKAIYVITWERAAHQCGL